MTSSVKDIVGTEDWTDQHISCDIDDGLITLSHCEEVDDILLCVFDGRFDKEAEVFLTHEQVREVITKLQGML
jgi:hypothetical protein